MLISADDPEKIGQVHDGLTVEPIDALSGTVPARNVSLGILSVPRDLQVRIPGYGLQKINAAYFFGQYDHLPGGGPGLDDHVHQRNQRFAPFE